jgi:polyribonucleotide nucleotidyltransferase
LIGKGGKNLKHLHAKYGVNFKFPKDDSTAKEITAIGPKANLNKARDELLDLLAFHLENSHQETLQIPAQFLGSVLGRGGSRLTGIEVSSDCRISFDRRDEAVTFTLSGSKDGIKTAKADIESIAFEQVKRKVAGLRIVSPVLFRRKLKKFHLIARMNCFLRTISFSVN